MKDVRPVFLDLQTAGGSHERDPIVELAYAVGDAEVRGFLIKPPADCRVDGRRLKRLTGLELEELQESGLGLGELWQREGLAQLLQQHPVVIHFASFERRFLAHQLGFTIPRCICTHRLAGQLLPQLPSKSLRAVAGYCGHHVEELKRARDHVAATRSIWQVLQTELCSGEGMLDWGAVQDLAQQRKARPELRPKPPGISRQTRLGLPKQPGVYRFFSFSGHLLYVGKAKNLHSRVNSYFRGQKSKGSRLQEMLSQVAEIKWDVCDLPIAAALMEVEAIKRHHPPYNRALREDQQRHSPFYLDSQLQLAEAITGSCEGPFTQHESVAYILEIVDWLLGGDVPELSSLTEVLEDIRQAVRQRWQQIKCRSRWQRLRQFAEQACPDAVFADDPAEWGEADVVVYVANRLKELCSYADRGRWLRRLYDCDIGLRPPSSEECWGLSVECGHFRALGWLRDDRAGTRRLCSKKPGRLAQALDRETIDLLRVLYTELNGAVKEGYTVEIRFGNAQKDLLPL